MEFLGPVAVLAQAVGLGLGTGWILRRLPPPVDEPQADLYRPLADVRFSLAAGLGAFASAALVAWFLEPRLWSAWIGLNTVGVLLALIDSRTTYLPLRLTQAGWALTAAGVLVTAWLSANPWVPAVAAGAAALWSFVFWVFWRFGSGFGFGDVRLAALAGATAGSVSFHFATWGLLLAGLVGVVLGLISVAARRGRAYPYGPALVLGPYVALLATLWSR